MHDGMHTLHAGRRAGALMEGHRKGRTTMKDLLRCRKNLGDGGFHPTRRINAGSVRSARPVPFPAADATAGEPTGDAMGGAAPQPKRIVPTIVAMARNGDHPMAIAAAVSMPVGFVRQVIESAVADGRIGISQWHDACASGACTPQPGSLLCAGCPFRPR